jgi:hypothetical protein
MAQAINNTTRFFFAGDFGIQSAFSDGFMDTTGQNWTGRDGVGGFVTLLIHSVSTQSYEAETVV